MFHEDGISVLGTDSRQKEPCQENMRDEEGFLNPHSVAAIMAICDAWAGTLSCKSIKHRISFPCILLASSGIAASICLHDMHRLSRDLAQDNQS